jgi:cell division protein FtsI (penicillin-binding protein 3)
MGAVANEGRLMEPRLVSRIVDSKGRTTRRFTPRVRRQVIPRATARLLADMMTGVTEEGGTGLEAGLGDMLVAGKTGTAQKADFLSGGYTDLWVASFIGFVPADRPRLVIAVVVDEPLINHTGGVVAAPVFRRIADRSLRYLGEMPSRVAATSPVNLPAPATSAAPAAPPVATESDIDVIVPSPRTPRPSERVVPDLSGKTLRDALAMVGSAGLALAAEGAGRSVRQDPGAGEIVAVGTQVRALFEAPR